MSENEFCLIHGYDYMTKDSIFDVFEYCSKCEEEKEETPLADEG